ncbi:cell wall-active antibiotics response protein [Geothrix fuzhouensis]|uniref:cell wall-active antibiotics response protein n=1 Tax=Geothrix fuzhouensis TaxID=2966451 RepID=UPI0021486196|nr:cell wall-active antibiotics response protein [Geothrix fuzhouensis]
MNAPNDAKAPSPFSPKLVVGVAIIVAGLVLTLDNLGLIEAHTIFKLWPLVLVAMGVAKIRQDRGGSNLGGWFLVLGGAFLLLFTFGHGHLADALGPMLVVAVGILIVTKALKQNRGVPPELARSEDFLQGTAIFGGFKRRVSTQTFKGGELTAIFGGYEVDLRQAVLENGQARIDVFVLFGGGEIRVPEGWEISNRATAIAGALNDSTHHGPASPDSRPRLVVTGLILFGGTEVKS